MDKSDCNEKRAEDSELDKMDPKATEEAHTVDAGTASQLREEADLANVMSAEEYLMHKDEMLLDYEKRMFLDLVHTDGLMVCAKGLDYSRALSNILKVYSDAGNLVLVINSSNWEEKYYKSKLERNYVHQVSNTAAERERVYLEGGVQFISTRVLIVDLLKNRIPIELITGIVVLRAHTIVESCQEAFVLRLYRQRNKVGFIKAFSSRAEAFSFGFGHIERTMRNLFVKELFIWPRFHAIAQASLKPYEAQTVELHVQMTQKMQLIQTHILDIMNYLVREIKRINPTVDMEEITVENCIAQNFQKILQAQLDSLWHQLNAQTKRIVSDLKILRNLIIATTYNDAVGAYALIKRYRTTEYALDNSGWTLLDAAEQVFKLSKDRIYNGRGEFEPEFCPKWKYLAEILQVEIPGDMKRLQPGSLQPPKVLILCQDKRTCFQLKQFLTQNGERYLLYEALRHKIAVGKVAASYNKIDNANVLKMMATQEKAVTQKMVKRKPAGLSQISGAQEETTEAEAEAVADVVVDELTQLLTSGDADDIFSEKCFQESYMLTMTQALNVTDVSLELLESTSTTEAVGADTDTSFFEPCPELADLDITAVIAASKQPLIFIQTFKTEGEGDMALNRVLEEIHPQYVIMYHCNVPAIRQLEVYEARQRRPAKERIKVFFLIHAHTVEEQGYLTSLRRENQAFELIIETKRTMVIPEYQDGKTDEAFIMYKSYEDNDNTTTRCAGGQVIAPTVTPKIIVDMREFRSDLPCLIHKRGIEVLPLTITIGDYILTPEICVERKSISDLIGSLNSGRLYNQCVQMQRHYAKPILLIEFDQNKQFHLQGKLMVSQNIGSTKADIVQKLQLLTLHFPRLRLIWSPSPYATAQLFEELKLGKPEPDPKQATTVGCYEAEGSVAANEPLEFNPNIYDFLLRLPGVTTRNVHKLMRHGGSLKQLLKRTQAELGELLESQKNGLLLWDILHVVHLPETTSEKPFGKHSRFRRGAAATVGARGTVRKFRQ